MNVPRSHQDGLGVVLERELLGLGKWSKPNPYVGPYKDDNHRPDLYPPGSVVYFEDLNGIRTWTTRRGIVVRCARLSVLVRTRDRVGRVYEQWRPTGSLWKEGEAPGKN